MIAFLRRALGSLFPPHPRVVAFREEATAALSYANHVVMMRRCVDELRREARERVVFAQRLSGLLRHEGTPSADAELRFAIEEAREALAELRTQKAELDAMVATQARQEERFAQNRAGLVQDGFDVDGIVLSPPDVGRAEYEADQLIASFELESELGSSRPLH